MRKQRAIASVCFLDPQNLKGTNHSVRGENGELSCSPFQTLPALLRLGTVLKKQRKYQEAGRQYELIRDIGLKENDPRLVQEMERNIREMGNLVGEEAGTPCFPYQPSQPRPKGPIIEVIE